MEVLEPVPDHRTRIERHGWRVESDFFPRLAVVENEGNGASKTDVNLLVALMRMSAAGGIFRYIHDREYSPYNEGDMLVHFCEAEVSARIRDKRKFNQTRISYVHSILHYNRKSL